MNASAKKLLNELDSAITPQAVATKPAPRPFENVRRQLEPHRPEGSLSYAHNRPRFGVPQKTLEQLRDLVKAAVPDFAAIAERVSTLNAQAKATFSELGKVAARSATQMHAEHLRDLAQTIARGETPVSDMDGYSLDEWAADRESKIAAFKVLLADLALQIHSAAEPALSAACKATLDLIETELISEGSRNNKYGIPYQEPSEILRSLRAAADVFKLRLDVPPTGYADAATITASLLA